MKAILSLINLLLFTMYHQSFSQTKERETDKIIYTEKVVKDTLLVEQRNVVFNDVLQPVKKVFIQGIVLDNGNKENDFAGVQIGIKGTKVYTTTDNKGNYKLDITDVVDTLQRFTVLCYFINHYPNEVSIKGRIKKDTIINFDLKQRPGIDHPEVEIKKKK